MTKIAWSPQAIADVNNIYDYISSNHFEIYANHQINRILNNIERLRQFPIPEFPVFPQREILIDRYRLIYTHRPDLNEIRIVTILHGSRLLKSI
jgi:addiction module RelE/StbE family toxin